MVRLKRLQQNYDVSTVNMFALKHFKGWLGSHFEDFWRRWWQHLLCVICYLFSYLTYFVNEWMNETLGNKPEIQSESFSVFYEWRLVLVWLWWRDIDTFYSLVNNSLLNNKPDLSAGAAPACQELWLPNSVPPFSEFSSTDGWAIVQRHGSYSA